MLQHFILCDCQFSQAICKPIPTLRAALNELFYRHLLTTEECSEVARTEKCRREDHLAQVLLTKPAEVVQEACQVLEKHGCPVKELKSELYHVQ